MSDDLDIGRAQAIASNLAGVAVTVAVVDRCDTSDPDAVGLALYDSNTIQLRSDQVKTTHIGNLLAHEAAHLRLHRGSTKGKRQKESEADDFAYQFVRDFHKRFRFPLHEYLLGYWPEIAIPQPSTPTTGGYGGLKSIGGRLVVLGSEVKALPGGKVAGYLVRFTDADHPDLTGDYFDHNTDFDIEDGDLSAVFYNHGLDPTLKKRKLARGALSITDAGVWIEAQLALRDDYERAIYSMAQAGKLGWSSGTLPNLVERVPVGKSMWIKSWPLGGDASLTPTPAAGIDLTAAVVKAYTAPQARHNSHSGSSLKWLRKQNSMNRS